MRKLIVCAVFLFLFLPFMGLGSVSGNVGLRTEWRGGDQWDLTGFTNLNLSAENLALNAYLSVPIPELSWSLTLRGSVYLDPLRTVLQLRFSPGGLHYLRTDIYLSPPSWELGDGELSLDLSLGLELQDPFGSPSLAGFGNGALQWSWEDLWVKGELGWDLYPFPPALGRVVLAAGYRPYPWWITVRTSFTSTWDYASLEAGYGEPPLRASLQGTVGPGGFERLSFNLAFRPEPLEFRVYGQVPAGGQVSFTFVAGYYGDFVSITLKAGFLLPFSFQSAGVEVRFYFD